jgi:thiol-disulfide isomerase/thioredoxin
MTFLRVLAIVVVFPAFVICSPVIAEETSPTSPPAATSAPTEVPDPVLVELEANFNPPAQPMTPAETMKLLDERMQKVLQAGEQLEAKYPHAKNLIAVRSAMLRAASYMAMKNNSDAAAQQKMLDIAGRIVSSDIPAEEKVLADFLVVRDGVMKSRGDSGANAEKIRTYVARYEQDAAAAPISMVYGTILAGIAGDSALKDEFLGVLQAKYSGDPDVAVFLQRLGRSPRMGKMFTAELPKLGGGTLHLPQDTLGKVVVIDFWATWCGPCVRSMPEMKAVYSEYQPKGVEFIGVSLDESREALEQFIKDNQIPWTQTFSGKGWQDPTAQANGVDAIPNVWVIGRDGKVYAAGVGEELRSALDKALASPATTKP